jgi:trans-2,3-dihydro-3-hydroxyanthranilate isomerase
MLRRYVTVDVFTDRMFGGNPLAVVLDAEGLSAAQMQAIAAEFNYSETTFVLPPRSAANSARVRIFTARTEVPFAGHPNVGTAVVLARELEAAGRPAVGRFVFEEGAGLVLVELLRDGGRIVGAEFRAPEGLSRRATVPAERVAACLSLPVGDVRVAVHVPEVVSVGLPFLVAELTSRDALSRATPVLALHEQVLPAVGTDAIYAYVRGVAAATLHARTFAPIDATVEDPATGSATGAAIALLATLQPEANAEVAWRIEQGVDMGRPSLLLGRTAKFDGVLASVHIAGHAVPVMRGVIDLGTGAP